MQLTQEQIAQFDREGYLFFPGLFTPEEIQVLIDEVPRLYAQHRPENVREKMISAVRPQAIRDTALLTIEGELDDISGNGQTEAAHLLCLNIPAGRREHFLAPGVGHYGIFSGRRWRETIYPRVRDFIKKHS